VQFQWNHASLPSIGALDALGPDDTRNADVATALILAELEKVASESAPQTESLGSGQEELKRAALMDLPLFLDTLLAPLLLAEWSMKIRKSDSPKTIGMREALLVQAADEVATDPLTAKSLHQASNDEAVLAYLQSNLVARYSRLLESLPVAGPSEQPLPDNLDIEALGSNGWQAVLDRIGELFRRIRRAPRRVTTTALLAFFRRGVNANLTRFCGDVFVYLQKRGDVNAPGDIPKVVLDALRNTRRETPSEPLVVITHSMGGNIVYDILTHFAPDVQVDDWVSVGGQVGLFEEMNLFHSSNPGVRTPNKVTGLPTGVRHWLNVYDPVDPFAFLTAPVFKSVDRDDSFKTGAGDWQAHGAYFTSFRFYRLIYDWLQRVLSHDSHS
jgi:hypothetical protein